MKTVIGKVPATIMRDIRTKIQPKHPSLPELLSAETVKLVARSALESWFAAFPLVWGPKMIVLAINGNVIHRDKDLCDISQ